MGDLLKLMMTSMSSAEKIQTISEAEAYLLQKPKLTRQTVCQKKEDFMKDGIPICYDPLLYRIAVKIVDEYHSKQLE